MLWHFIGRNLIGEHFKGRLFISGTFHRQDISNCKKLFCGLDRLGGRTLRLGGRALWLGGRALRLGGRVLLLRCRANCIQLLTLMFRTSPAYEINASEIRCLWNVMFMKFTAYEMSYYEMPFLWKITTSFPFKYC